MRILDEQEKAIVRQLIRDPRESDNGVGEVTGVNVRTVSRKRDRLEQEGILSYYTNLDLSADGAKQYNARHLYIIKFKVGITYNQLIQEIRKDANQQPVFTETIFESQIAEIDGKVALLLFVDGNSDLDIVQRTHEELIPGLLKNHGSDCIESISTMGSSMWPSTSTKKKYSQFLRFEGRLSILLMLNFNRLNGSRAE